MRLTFEDGTLLLRDCSEDEQVPTPFVWDGRVDHWRAQALHYRQITEELRQSNSDFRNTAPRYNRLRLKLRDSPEPHPHQRESMDDWQSNGCRGVVVLPTGSGKSYVGLMAIVHVGRSTLVVAPTIDLMNQWYDLLTSAFDTEVGIMGGGYHEA